MQAVVILILFFFHRHLDFEPLITNEEERKAFFINLYNIQMIHGLVAQENLPETPTKVQVREYSPNDTELKRGKDF